MDDIFLNVVGVFENNFTVSGNAVDAIEEAGELFNRQGYYLLVKTPTKAGSDVR